MKKTDYIYQNKKMIYETLNCIAEDINDYLRNQYKIAEDKLVVSNILNPDGTASVQGENKIVLTLVNIQTGNLYQAKNTMQSQQQGNDTIELQIMFSTYFSGSNYMDGLNILFKVIEYIQHKPVLTASNSISISKPGAFSAMLERISLVMQPANMDTMSKVWAMLGANYMPSVLYTVQVLAAKV